MATTTLDLFKAVIAETDIEVTIREDYSGRGMMGKTTGAIVGDRQDIITLIAQAGIRLGVFHGVDDNETFLNDIKNLRWDNMGQQQIAY